jgi:hypothetical protein
MRALKSRFLPVAILSIVLLFSVNSYAQVGDFQGIRLNDGSVIYGKILQVNVEKVTVEDKDGKISVYNFNDVQSFIKEGRDEPTQSDLKETTEGKPEVKTTSFAPLPRHSFEFGPELSYIQYEEPDVMKEKGMMYGIGASYAYHNKLMLKGEGKFSFGFLDYEGSTWGGTPLTINNIPNYMWEFRGLIGYDFAVFKATTITPYLGLGYRYLNDNSQQKSSSGYKRESNYLYCPIGIEAVTNFNNGWSMGAAIEYDVFLWGKQKSHLSDIDPGFNLVENDQNTGYGIRGSIKFIMKAGKIDFILEPFIKYWNISESKVADVTYYGAYLTSVVEPKNNSSEIGCKFVVKF